MAKEKKSTTSIADYRALPLWKYLGVIMPICRDGGDPLTQQVRIIGALNYMTEQQVLALPIPEYTRLAAEAKFLEQPCDASRAGRIASHYRLGEWDLVPTKDYTKMTAGQFIDFQALAKDPEKNLVQLLSVFLIPAGHAYNDGYDIDAVQDAIGQMSVQDAMEVMAFFLGKSNELLRDSLSSLERAAKTKAEKTELKKMLAALSRSAGDGFTT